MKKRNVFLLIALLALGLPTFAQTGGGTTVKFNSLTVSNYYERDMEATLRIIFEVTGEFSLNQRNVTITPANAAEIFTANILGVEGNNYIFLIRLSDITQWGQEITVNFRKDGYTFTPSSRTILLDPEYEDDE